MPRTPGIRPDVPEDAEQATACLCAKDGSFLLVSRPKEVSLPGNEKRTRMNLTISERISGLRQYMQAHGLSAVIIPTADPHLSEYTAAHWKTREWFSGFTGSAGTLAVTLGDAGLWTDSRYFLQAEQQLQGTPVRLFKEGIPGTPSLPQWLGNMLQKHEKAGVDGRLFSLQAIEQMEETLRRHGILLETGHEPEKELWADRPPLPLQPAFIHPLCYAGQPAKEKMEAIRASLQESGAHGILLSALDEIAWALNLRGSDIDFNPVFTAYLLITREKATLFIHPQKLTAEVREYLAGEGVATQDYTAVGDSLRRYPHPDIQIDPAQTNHAACAAFPATCRLIRRPSPAALLKAVKNDTEIRNLHTAMRRDGVAMVQFLHWLETAISAGERVTETGIGRKLHEFRSRQPHYMGDSFETIAAYGKHAAIVHYTATPEEDAVVLPQGFLLIDSGAQYLEGTTDITRTIAMGTLTQEEKRDYTLVLKGHIDLAMCCFPLGTRGAQLDCLARAALWKDGANFLHGTGHGVGSFLCVHEGPQSIRMNENPVALLPGMVTSNEPGLYKAGRHGIRTENLTVVVPFQETEFGQFCRFDTATLCPIDTKGILPGLLTEEEKDWLNGYHRRVYAELSPFLDGAEKEWLRENTQEI